MELTGRIKEVKEISEKFRCQSFIMDLSSFDRFTGEKTENYAEIQVNNAVVEELKKFSTDDIVKVSFYVKGRYVVSKDTGEEMFFQTLVGYKIEKK